jgi:hypothetical protein
MKEQQRWPEVLVGSDFLIKRSDIINEVTRPQRDVVKVSMDHPVLGTVVEVYRLFPEHKILSLKSVCAKDMQEEEEMEVVKDYYNNHLLGGKDTYIDCFNPDVGYFLMSRNDN